MTMNTKEVFFYKYCDDCKYADCEEDKDPCNECLTSPANEDSHKPIFFTPSGRYGGPTK